MTSEQAFARIRTAKDKSFSAITFVATAIAAVMLIVLLYKIFADGLGRLDWDFITSMSSRKAQKAGIYPALLGSIYVVILTGLISIPIGIGAAVYLEELIHRKSRFSNLIELNISNLAGVPSIVYGLLGLAVFVRAAGFERSVLAGACTMSLLILPMLITVVREALRAVPRSYREASLALGTTQWQTIWNQVLPASASGIFTGIILSLSRAMGETAPLIVAGAATFVTMVPTKPSDPYTVLPIQIFNWSSNPQKAFHTNAAAAIIVLMVVLITLNSVAIVLRSRSQRRS